MKELTTFVFTFTFTNQIDQMLSTELQSVATQVRRDVLRMIHAVQSGHPGGSLGCTDFMVVLYANILKHSPHNFLMDGRNEDLFFLSNGHLSALWYSVLARNGYFPVNELKTFRKLHSRLQGHPTTAEGLPGVRIASGSLGQGLSAALGAGLTKKLNGDPQFVFCLQGDGEMQEGQVWEAALFGAARNVDNVIAVIDYNNKQIDGDVSNVMNVADLKAKWKAFNWQVHEMDGHNFSTIENVLKEAQNACGKGKPQAIIMHTHMGQGVDYMLDNHNWHGSALNDDQLRSALSQLPETLGDY